ncbi:MAG: class I SAM-dependent methyltransferase [Sedimentisphaerales bacterium]|nr:class I SAM-dependent methyltransferase [Sedimentisphaerales bacterium]MBN2844068.1 class I SAM-dependent methyltransferase [Sedimentisphaerales bacterium]
MNRLLKNLAKQMWHKVFALGQRCGVDILPRHFYSEVPDMAKLRRTESWKKPYNMSSLSLDDIDMQLEFVRNVCSGSLFQDKASAIFVSSCTENGEPGYGPIEAQVLYGFICNKKPARIVQVGCGVSTAIILNAATDSGYVPEIICIEPYPNAYISSLAEHGKVRLIDKGVEDVGAEVFGSLQAGDLFFVDSSHTLGPAGEVTRLIIDILPLLAVGVYIHFHDIWVPYDYSGWIMADALTFWHETALMMGFLSFNGNFRAVASLSLIHYQRSAELQTIIPDYSPRGSDYALVRSQGHYPSSLYLQRVK